MVEADEQIELSEVKTITDPKTKACTRGANTRNEATGVKTIPDLLPTAKVPTEGQHSGPFHQFAELSLEIRHVI